MGYKTTEIERGTRFGKLVTTSEVFLKTRSDGRNRAWVTTICDCGKTKDVVALNLFSGNTTSCGCYHKQVVSKKMTTHGDSRVKSNPRRPRLYSIWKGMRERCTNPNAQNYKWYGGKGISICDEWYTDFSLFKAWSLQHGYADKLELDRIDSEKNYEPDNCRWVTKKQNLRNRDHCWSDATDKALVTYAKENDLNPYEVIRLAVESFLTVQGASTLRSEGGES